MEKIATDTGGIYLEQDPRRSRISDRMKEGVKWLEDSPVFTFDLHPAVRNDGRTHHLSIGFSTQPGRAFDATVLMPDAPRWQISRELALFAGALVALCVIFLVTGRSRRRPYRPAPRPVMVSDESSLPGPSAPRQSQTMQAEVDLGYAIGSKAALVQPPLGGTPGSWSVPSGTAFHGSPGNKSARNVTRILSNFPSPSAESPCCALRVTAGPGTGQVFSMRNPQLSIGRDQEVNTFSLQDPGISGRHATLRWSSGVLTITDEKSTNGTIVGNQPLKPSTPYSLQDGDQIRIGSTTIVVHSSAQA
jgi:hypothetical protein